MNMISFANFDNFETPKSFFPETEPTAGTEDFSAILSNISVALQPPVAPDQPVVSEDCPADPKISLDIPPGQIIAGERSQSEIKLLEAPGSGPQKQVPANSSQMPETARLWAGNEPPVPHKLDVLRSEVRPKEKINSALNELFQYQPTPTPPVKPELNTEPQIIETAPVKPAADAGFTETVDIDINPLPQTDPTQTAEEVILPDGNIQADKILTAAEKSPVDDMMLAEITQRINEVLSEEPVVKTTETVVPQGETKTEFRNDDLFQAVPDTTRGKSVKNAPVKTPADVDSPPIVSQTETQTAEPLFQAVPETVRTKEPKPVNPVSVNPSSLPRDPQYWTNEGSKIKLPTIAEPTLTAKNDSFELPVVPEIESVEFQTVQNAPLKTAFAVANPVRQSNIVEFQTTEKLPEIAIKPQFDGDKLNNFKITPNEVRSILNTFDRFFKTSEQTLTVDGAQPAAPGAVATEGLTGITTSIKDSFEAIIKDAGQTSSATGTDSAPTENLWSGEQRTPFDKPVKTPLEPLSQRLNMQEFEQAKKKLVEITQNQNNSAAAVKPVVTFDARVKTVEGRNNAADFEIEDASETTKISFIDPIETEPAVKPAALKNELTGDQPKNDSSETDPGFAVKFDKFFENVNKATTEPVKPADVEPAKMLDQINPHLLELAALADKKREKQTLKLRLHPAELGTVEIKLERNNAGTLNAYFQTETEGARQALSQNLEQLRDSLQNAGWQVGQMEISYGSNSSTANQHRESNSRYSETVENFDFSRRSEKPDVAEQQNPANRLLSLLA